MERMLCISYVLSIERASSICNREQRYSRFVERREISFDRETNDETKFIGIFSRIYPIDPTLSRYFGFERSNEAKQKSDSCKTSTLETLHLELNGESLKQRKRKRKTVSRTIPEKEYRFFLYRGVPWLSRLRCILRHCQSGCERNAMSPFVGNSEKSSTPLSK